MKKREHNCDKELKIYELLGVKQFRKLTFKLEKLIHKKDGKKNKNYHIEKLNQEAMESFKKYLFYNGSIHVKNAIRLSAIMIGIIAFKGFNFFLIPMAAILTKDLYCIMLQRYNFKKINQQKERLKQRQQSIIRKEKESLDKEKLKEDIKSKNINIESMIEQIKTLRKQIKDNNVNINNSSNEIIEVINRKKYCVRTRK